MLSIRTGLSLVNLACCAPKNASSGKCRHPKCGVVASHLMTSEMLSAKEQAGDGGPYWEHPNPMPTCEHPGWESDTLVPLSFLVMFHSLGFGWESEATWWPAQGGLQQDRRQSPPGFLLSAGCGDFYYNSEENSSLQLRSSLRRQRRSLLCHFLLCSCKRGLDGGGWAAVIIQKCFGVLQLTQLLNWKGGG